MATYGILIPCELPLTRQDAWSFPRAFANARVSHRVPQLEITVDEFGVRLERVAPGPRLVKVGRRLVARPTAATDVRPSVDVAALVEEERNRWP